MRGGGIKYYIFEEKALNTFDEALATIYKQHSTLKQIVSIPMYTLESILDTHLPSGTQIDFLSIDCEGLDLEVLQSNNFAKYRPTYIVVEISTNIESMKDLLESRINTFLETQDYKIVDKSFNSVFFKDSKS